MRDWLCQVRRLLGREYADNVPYSRSGPRLEPIRRLPDLDRFIGMWVAVKGGEVIAAAHSSRALAYAMAKQGQSARGAVVQFVPPPSRSSMVGVG